MSKKQNIFLIGPMGAGKTSIGRQLAKELQREFYDSDAVIEQRTGADIPWILDIEGEEGFRKRETDVLLELTKLQEIILATGGGAVVKSANRAALAANGIVIYLKTSLEEQLERTEQSKKRPLAKEDSIRKATLEKLQGEYSAYYEELADIIYESDYSSVHTIARDIINKLKNGNYL